MVTGQLVGRFQYLGQIVKQGVGHNLTEGVQSQIALAQLFVAVLMAARGIHAVVEMQGTKSVQANQPIKLPEYTV